MGRRLMGRDSAVIRAGDKERAKGEEGQQQPEQVS